MFKPKSIRAFIGAKDYNESRRFYREIGFSEHIVSDDMSYFLTDNYGFYLQDYYVKSWIENTMIFFELENTDEIWTRLHQLDLPSRYKKVKLSRIREESWGRECFLHDPSGVLWHFGEFY